VTGNEETESFSKGTAKMVEKMSLNSDNCRKKESRGGKRWTGRFAPPPDFCPGVSPNVAEGADCLRAATAAPERDSGFCRCGEALLRGRDTTTPIARPPIRPMFTHSFPWRPRPVPRCASPVHSELRPPRLRRFRSLLLPGSKLSPNLSA